MIPDPLKTVCEKVAQEEPLTENDWVLVRLYSNRAKDRDDWEHLAEFTSLWCRKRITVEARLVGLLAPHGVRVSKWYDRPHYTLRRGEKATVVRRVTHALLNANGDDFKDAALLLLEAS